MALVYAWCTSESQFTVNRFKLAPEFLSIIEKRDGIFGGSFQVDVFVVRVKRIFLLRVFVERFGELDVSQKAYKIQF